MIVLAAAASATREATVSKLFVVVGGQFGSEGKGAVAGRICHDHRYSKRGVVNVRVGGPNAGHTVLGNCPKGCEGGHQQPVRQTGGPESGHLVPEANDAHPWRLRQVPVAAVTAPRAGLLIAAGSEVDMGVLREELEELDSAGYNASERLTVDRTATLLTEYHKMEEHERGLQKRLGSTAKGIGSARADRIWRSAERVGDHLNPGIGVGDTAAQLFECLRDDTVVVIEGTQGFGLGLHGEHYPFSTSGDCRAIDFVAQAGINPWQASGGLYTPEVKIVVCLRPYPIRVAGNSGKLDGETTWESLGLPVEHTTVTHKVRRVGTWDDRLARQAIRANGGPRAGVVWVALTMMDSVEPELAGSNVERSGWLPVSTPKSVLGFLHSMALDVRHLGYVGTGPDTAMVNTEMYR